MNKKITLLFGIALCLLVFANGQEVDMDFFKNMKARSIGPAGMSGRVTAIDAVVSDPNNIYVGTASGGLWKSESGGAKWEPIFDKEKAASIGSISIYQKNPDIIWVGTGEGNPRNSQSSGYGVYRTLDGGNTWECMGLEKTRNIHRIIVHPDDPNVVYVGAQGVAWGESEHKGVYRTVDGGKNWEKILYINENTGVADMVIDPKNPNKLIVAMWQMRRWPWYFESGGEGSGLYITYDGGDSFKRRTDKDGLPKGNLGRMGLAIAPSNTDIIYAYVESKKNALYKSTDGGFKWQRISTKGNFGNRPFYYADIFVDPANENRIYSIHTLVTVSEDGGKNFNIFVPAYVGTTGVHPDHHAWWIHPNDPNFMIEGNDGGMAITRDRGKTWRFVENIPVAQFYHINVDNEVPYNVYGGMQDNGSWRGPAYVFRSGGIRNAYWEELMFGDGFDVVPHPEDARFGYAMSQGGNIARYDYVTGDQKFIQPIHPDGEFLRYNWNAGVAQDPFNKDGLYFGSQYLHHSSDRGENWKLISGDLTTNDPEKQKSLESGGLTYDATQAENYTTIISIGPSPVEEGVVWVGTDDGNLQLTRDGGKTWNNLTSKLPDCPKNAWIAQIQPSKYEAGEVFVVVNNYRQNDWDPYLYRTRDYGATWERLADPSKVWGHCLSVVQDPVARNLIFLGTEYGLYVSFDEGQSWNAYKHGYPTVSTMDMVIHPREHDLVIGTFGRAAYVLDNILPLRKIALEGLEAMKKPLMAYPTPDAYITPYRQAAGTRFGGNAVYAGTNRARGAMITFSINFPEEKKMEMDKEETDAKAGKKKKKAKDEVMKEEMGKDEKMKKGKMGKKAGRVKIQIVDASGEVIRNLSTKADTGVNKVMWRLDAKGADPMRSGRPGARAEQRENGGASIMPGEYKVRISWGKHKDSTTVKVIPNPNMPFNAENWKASVDLEKQMINWQNKLTASYKQLKDAEKILGKVEAMMKSQEAMEDSVKKSLMASTKDMKDTLKSMSDWFNKRPEKQGIYRDPNTLLSKTYRVYSYLDPSAQPVNSSAKMIFDQYKEKVTETVNKINGFFKEEWPSYQEEVEKAQMSMFKKFEAVELD
ncbi:MAG: hypothetical protein MRZ79_25930 [Bacteroidia bacterium]|nr:hypothetical protein [Bacteroidia bacterium]